MDPLIRALAAAAAADPVDVVATVTTVNPGGTVNIQLRGAIVPGLQALRSYTDRKIGDRVIVRVRGGQMIVVGAAGPPPTAAQPIDLTVSDVAAPAGQGWREIVAGQLWAKPAPPGSLWCKTVAPYVPPPPTPAAPATLKKQAVDCDSYRQGERRFRSIAEQGAYLNAYGLQTGVWVFGAGAWGALAGKTVHNLRVNVQRNPVGHGRTYGPVPIKFRVHNVAALPLTIPALGAWYTPGELQLGQAATFGLPVAWAVQFRDGTAAGVAIDSENANDNLEALAGLSLEVDYS